MIIDCHGHFTTAPKELREYRTGQIAAFEAGQTSNFAELREFSDDELFGELKNQQMKLQAERGIDLALFSPIAGLMGHHFGNEAMSRHWTRTCNDLIHRVCTAFPNNFVPVAQLPQSPGVNPANCIEELEFRVKEQGFVACNLNPDPSDGYWTDPPITDRWWYPLYEKLVELDVPAMIHVSGSCNPNFHGTGAHYINGDTTVFMQLLLSDLFRDFPTLRFVIPHGGGAVPYHWGRYRGLAQDNGRPPLAEALMDNVFFDTCVYHQPGINLLTEVIPVKNVLFGSEMVGAVKSVDPETGHYFDDTKRYIDALDISDADRHALFEGNARRVYPRLDARLNAMGK
ncbi:amidohydrolase family protein [Frigidibacter sp. ROC022]|uniref:amidohydrolase family protein n=1 Tax=Frigidibacter sp. ROC022 TaxID=2971796 RepID=UPI00215AB317|nr:amidohydrolase family protein [Frigidibacter sp. ROC022]MCR8724527.1 amidohydrolase [Frigidibacter sp. ROC022]